MTRFLLPLGMFMRLDLILRRLVFVAAGFAVLGAGFSTAFAQGVFYVRAGAGGSGSDWANAYSSLPASLVRGATYYVAAGSYGGYTFDDPTSGSSVITVKKATASDHGTSTGWNSAYGSGQAVFGTFSFATDYYTFSGATRNESNWFDCSAYGFAIDGIFVNVFNFGHAADNVTFEYTDMGADCGSTNQASYGTCVYLGGFSETADNWIIRRSHIHNCRELGQMAGVHNILWEYNAMGPNWQKTGVRHQIRGSSVTFRYNVFKDACLGDPGDPSAGGCTAILGWYGNQGSNGENYSNSVVYGNVFINTKSTTFSDAVIFMGDDRTSQGGGPQNCSGCKILNNTFVGMANGQAILKFTGAKTNTEARNNIWYRVDAVTGCQAAACSNNLDTDTDFFVDDTGHNFHLTSDGVAGTGYTLSAPYDRDVGGLVRGSGAWDLGAFEFSGGSSASATPTAPTGLRVISQ